MAVWSRDLLLGHNICTPQHVHPLSALSAPLQREGQRNTCDCRARLGRAFTSKLSIMKLGLMSVFALLCFCKSKGLHEFDQETGNEMQKRGWSGQSRVVAFHVYYGGLVFVGHKGHAGRVPYNIMTMNIGGGYNKALHAFIAPLSGLYMFNIDGLSSNSGPGCINLRKNGVTLDEGHTTSHWSTMVISRPLLLKKGDSVFVVTCPRWTYRLGGGFGNSFSGFLIREM